MVIAGIQPLSLIDYPEKPCSIIFTQGCVFRCSYCHNPELIPLESKDVRDVSDVLSFLDARKGIVDAVCITGGEPTIQKGLIDFVIALKQLGFTVKLDTNGICPDAIERLIAGRMLDYIAMDVKAQWEKYLTVIKIGGVQTVAACKKTFSLIQHSGIEHEFRTTIMPGVHTRDDFLKIAAYLKPGERYFIQKTSFTKTLEPLDATHQIDSSGIVEELRSSHPSLTIGLR